MRTKAKALEDLAGVVPVIAAIDSGRWARLRAVEPWVEAARRSRATWLDLEPVLRTLLPDWSGVDPAQRSLRAAQLMAKLRGHRAREFLRIDLDDVAAAAGVVRPDCGAREATPTMIPIPSRVLSVIEKLADGRQLQRSNPPAGGRTSASSPPSDRAQLVFTPGPAAPSPSISDLAVRSTEKRAPSLDQFVETEQERLEREAAERRARLEARSKLVVTLPGGPAGNVGEK